MLIRLRLNINNIYKIVMFEYLIAALIAASLSYASGLIPIYTKLKNIELSTWLAFAAGVLIATAFFEMIPASLGVGHGHGLEEDDHLDEVSDPGHNESHSNETEHTEEDHKEETASLNILLIALGFFIFYLIEQIVTVWGHKKEYHENHSSEPHVHHTGLMGVIALAADNIVDGASMTAAWLVSPAVGIPVTLAVIAHEIPHSLATVSILKGSGTSNKKILWILLGVVSLFPLTALFVATTGIFEMTNILAFTAGAFLYFGASHLLPESHEKTNWKVISAFLIGAILFYLTTLIG